MAHSINGVQRVAAYTAYLLSIIIVIMVIYWMCHYQDGVSWSAPQVFNWHPILMLIGMVFLPTQALLAYRVLPFSHATNKAYHFFCHVTSWVFIGVGLAAVFRFHDLLGILDVYSLHSWFGLTTVVLFGLQFVAGFSLYQYPKPAIEIRAAALPYHGLLGIFSFIMAVATSSLGILEKVTFLEAGAGGIDKQGGQARLAGAIGIMLLMLLLCVFTTLSKLDAPAPVDHDQVHLETSQSKAPYQQLNYGPA